jgi:hypothetical protein
MMNEEAIRADERRRVADVLMDTANILLDRIDASPLEPDGNQQRWAVIKLLKAYHDGLLDGSIHERNPLQPRPN